MKNKQSGSFFNDSNSHSADIDGKKYVCPCCGETSVENYGQTCDDCLNYKPESNSDETIIEFSDEDEELKTVYDNLLNEGDKAIFYTGYCTGVKSQQSIIDEAVELLKANLKYVDTRFISKANYARTKDFLNKIEKE